MKDLNSISRAESVLHLDHHLDNSRLSVRKALSDGFENWKDEAGLFIGFGTIHLIILVVLILIPFIGQIVSSLMIAPTLSLGGYLFAHKVRNNERREFGDFFAGFDYLGEIVLSGLILFGFVICLIIPLGLLFYLQFDVDSFDIDNPISNTLFVGICFLALGGIYVSVLLLFIQHFIGFYKLSGWQAICYSVKFGHKNWFKIFAFFLIVSLIVTLGIFGIFIGIFITYSFIYPMTYEAFRRLTNLDEFLSDGRNDNTISQHLI